MRNFETIFEELRSCKFSADNEKLQPLFTELEMAILEYDKWPDSLFQGILNLQQDEGYRCLDSSWTLLYFLSNNWDGLTSQQRDGLRGVLVEGFDKYHNWMGAFVTSELLGERYADKYALVALTDLGKKARLPARAAVPHGLEVLVRTTPDESLRTLAIDQLRELEKTDSEQVRQEALISLKKLAQ